MFVSPGSRTLYCGGLCTDCVGRAAVSELFRKGPFILMQIAGNKCRICDHKIVFAHEGKACVHCGTFVHVNCEPRAFCDVCGQLFQQYELPKPDPLREAYLPRALRPAKGGGWAIAVLGAAIVAIFFLGYILLTLRRTH